MDKKKEILYSDFNSIDNIMSSVLQNPKLKDGMKKATVFKFWSNAAGKKFEKYSKAVSINHDNVLTVACANAAVSSELLMFKKDILKKINQYSIPLGIEIADINFSHKIWNTKSSNGLQPVLAEEKNPYKPDLTDFDPDKIELEPEEIETIRKSVNNNKFASPEQREKMFNAIILNLKTQKYIKKISP